MIDIADLYRQFCESKVVQFQLDDNVRPYDNTTLFCPAGMQQFKEKKRQDKVVENYNRNKDKPKFKDKSSEWSFDTMGIDIDFIKSLEDK